MDDDDLEGMAATLERSGRYRVLRRLVRPACTNAPGAEPTRRGLLLDLETTGLRPQASGALGQQHADEVLEVAAVVFHYTRDGRITGVEPAYERLRQPSILIPPEITKLTGITDAMVAGRTMDPDELAAVVAPAELIIAHNARFDRPFAERLHPVFAGKAWACSMSQVPWGELGAEGVKLSYLVSSAGLYHEGHCAADDAYAVVALLGRVLGDSGRTALAHLLYEAGRTTWRLRAVGAPYAFKGWLRARGYRWHGGEDGQPRAWYRDMAEDEVGFEVQVLRTIVFDPDWQPHCTIITAHNRFSHRA